MTKFRDLIAIISLMLLALMTASEVLAADFCWKDTQPRGAGLIPTACASDRTNISGLCYTSCRAGYTMGAFGICSQACPAGYSSSGVLTCHIDKPLTGDGTWKCTDRDALGTCWWSVLQCPAGYTNAGLFCALTTPKVPAGYSGTSLDPIRSTYTQNADNPGRIPSGCPAGSENQAGLCYKSCNADMKGVGPVCWSKAPPNWVECGMGAASSSAKCGEIVFDQVASVGELALAIVSAGTSTKLTAAAKLTKLAELKKAYKAAKAANPKLATAARNSGTIYDGVGQARTTADILESGAEVSTITDEDLVRLAATVASLVDPSGVSGVVASYTYPLCSKVAK